MEYCPECGTRVRPDVAYCHGCGKDLREYREWAASTSADGGDAATAGTDAAPVDPGPGEAGRSAGTEVSGRARDETDPRSDADPRGGAERDRSRRTDPRPGDRARPTGPAGRNAGSAREYGTGRQAGAGSSGASPAGHQGQPREGATGPGGRSPAAADAQVVDPGPSLTERAAALPLMRSATVGAGLALVSYLATYLAFAVDALVVHGGDHSLGPTNLLPLTDVTAGSAQQMWELVAWLFYAGHNVPIERSGAGGSEAVDVLGEGYWTQFTVPRLVTPELYTLVPLAVLVAGGAVYVRYNVDATLDGERSDLALLGASVLVGYAAVAAAGTTLVGVAEGGASTGPPLVDAALWTGLVAGGAGAVGGVVSGRIGGDAADDGAASGGPVDGDEAVDGDGDATPPNDGPAPADDGVSASADDAVPTTDATTDGSDDAVPTTDATTDGSDDAADAAGPVDAAPADDDR